MRRSSGELRLFRTAASDTQRAAVRDSRFAKLARKFVQLIFKRHRGFSSFCKSKCIYRERRNVEKRRDRPDKNSFIGSEESRHRFQRVSENLREKRMAGGNCIRQVECASTVYFEFVASSMTDDDERRPRRKAASA